MEAGLCFVCENLSRVLKLWPRAPSLMNRARVEKKKFLYRSEERRPKRLQVLIQL